MAEKTRILIAERDEPIASLLRSAASRAIACDVTVVHDSRAAAQALETGIFDLVLLDIGMDSDGLETLVLVRGKNRSCEVIALTTGVIAAPVLKTLATADVFAVVAKPFDVAQLAATLRESVRSDRTETPNRPLVYRERGADPTLK